MARPRTLAGWVVAATTALSVALLVGFIARHGTRIPFNDEYANLGLVFGDGVTLRSYWDQHNEHRIPLPRLVYVAAVRAAGYDFRAPMVVDATLLVAVTVLLLAVARRLRGRTAAADVFIPLTVLGLGGWENLIWSFQVQFILSTVFALLLLCLFVSPGFATSPARVMAAGLLAVLLPLCGANGVALVPAVAVGLLYLAWRNLSSGRRALYLPGATAAVFAVAALAVVAAYFSGLRKVEYHAPPASLEPVAYAAINFLGLSAGPVTHLLHPPGYDRATVVGCAVAALVAATLARLVTTLRDPAERPRAVLLGCLLGGFLCLTAGLAYGRAGVSNIMGASRYITLAMPVLVIAYLAWVGPGGRTASRLVPAGLALAALAAVVPNGLHADATARAHAARLRKVDHEIRAGVPIGFVSDGNRSVHPGEPIAFYRGIEYLRDHGVRPFSEVRRDPVLRSTPVPFRVVRAEGMAECDGFYTPTGDMGSIVLALPETVRAYGLALTYEGTGRRTVLQAMVSWDRDGKAPPAPGCGALDQLMVTTRPLTTRLLVDREVNTLRIDLVGPDAGVRVLGLAVLTRAE